MSDKTSRDNIAVVYVSNCYDNPPPRDFVVYYETGKPQTLPVTSPHKDLMLYPLMFPYGELRWAPKKLLLADTTDDYVTLLQYYAYMLFARDEFNPCVCMGSLSQQFIVNGFK